MVLNGTNHKYYIVLTVYKHLNVTCVYALCLTCYTFTNDLEIVFFIDLLFVLFVDDTRWTTVTKSNSGPAEDFLVSYQSLLPSTSYLFRIVAYNEYGISYPAYSDDVVCVLTVIIVYVLICIKNKLCCEI